MLTKIRIEKLFDIFDYDIELKAEGVTILTGPNGYGKTTVLKIIDALASQDSFFFIGLLFKKIIFDLSDSNTIVLKKDEKNQVEVIINKDTPFHWAAESLKEMIEENLPLFRHIEGNKWLDRRTKEVVSQDPLLQILRIEFPDFYKQLKMNEWPKPLKIPRVYFIREQRLLRPVIHDERRAMYGRHRFEADESIGGFKNTIEEYAKELHEKIKETLAESSQITQKLDSSFPRRLFDQTNDISEDEFTRRFNSVKKTQKALSEYTISDIKEDTHPTYKTENAKALHVYINDAEQKLAVFAELLRKLKAFTNILNKRRFTFKKIAVSKEEGFKFATNQGKPLALNDLSSGEQQEVVLLYELLFKVEPGTLVLIDEPELSLHVVWQKQFLDDIFDIIALQKINIVIATHSPQVINNHWDLTVDLEELRDAEASK
ncbi:MAG: AAA family ATPase [Mariprofundaceae bacterium]|nr:AAA family ATPase [Mariprofundaceae bacterium]